MMRTLAIACLLLVSAVAWPGYEPLPVAKVRTDFIVVGMERAPTREDMALQAALADYLAPFTEELPSVSWFRSVQLPVDEARGVISAGNMPGVWDHSRRAALADACRATDYCLFLLTDQLAMLESAFSPEMLRAAKGDRRREEEVLVGFAAAVTAMADVCGVLREISNRDARGRFCQEDAWFDWRLAAKYWWHVGRNKLALDLWRKASTEGAPEVPFKAGEQGAVVEIPAYALAEAQDQMDVARVLHMEEVFKAQGNWLEASDPVERSRLGGVRLAAFAVQARLAAKSGDPVAARLFLDVLAMEQKAGGIETPGCDIIENIAVARIALWQGHRDLDLDQFVTMRDGMRDRGCPAAWVSVRAVMQALRLGERGMAEEMLATQRADCGRAPGCTSWEEDALSDLSAVAGGRRDELHRVLAKWNRRVFAGGLTGFEREMSQLVAAALLAEPDLREEALGFYQALDRDLGENLAFSERLGSDMSRRSAARYEAIRGGALLARFYKGDKLSFVDLEAMRAQGILQRFRERRWQEEYRDVRDPQAEAELSAHREAIEKMRKELRELDDSTPSWAVLRLESERIAALGESIVRYRYFAKLSHLKHGIDAAYGGNWLYDPRRPDVHEGRWGQEYLHESEAYLTWLRVPGGYLELLGVEESRDILFAAKDRLVRRRFVADTPAITSILDIYGRLLAAGAGDIRGVRVVPRPDSDADGLVLEGIPVWRLPDGRIETATRPPEGARRVQSVRELSDALYAHFLQPTRALWQHANVLVISPDSDLALLPFETLTHHGVSVLEMVDIHYVQSLAVHEEIRRRSSPDRRRETMLSVADPVYVDGVDIISWQPLPGTRRESEKLAGLYKKNRQLLGGDARRARVLELDARKSLREYGVLHFATHGYADNQRSALVLSNDQGAEHAYLTDEDVSLLTLDSDLVLLSACDTGVGRNVSGEGVVGLPYAFFMAGNRNTLMSLWPVDDAGTAAFIPEFMRRVREGQDAVAALNDTKRAFLRGEHGKAWADSRIWAAFVLYGAAAVPEAGD